MVDDESCYFLSINRNKRSIELDLAAPDGRAAFERLVARSDVLIDNFRPGAMERMGYSDEALQRWNPGLIHCAISAFGTDGPARDRPGMDLLLQASGGLMSITGEDGRPPVRVGISVVDLIAGSYAVQGVLAALYDRTRTGLGQRVDVALQDGLVAWLSYHVTTYLMTGTEPRRMGASHPSVAPYGAYATADGWLVLAVGTDGLWRDLCVALDRPDLAADARFAANAGRCLHREQLDGLLHECFAAETATALAQRLAVAGVPCSAVRSLGEALADPNVVDRGLVVGVTRDDGSIVPTAAIPMRLSRTPGSVRLPPPRLGEHTREIMEQIGFYPGDASP